MEKSQTRHGYTLGYTRTGAVNLVWRIRADTGSDGILIPVRFILFLFITEDLAIESEHLALIQKLS